MGKELEKDDVSLKEETTGEAEAGGAFNGYMVRMPFVESTKSGI
jgi:hypothetical protein